MRLLMVILGVMMAGGAPAQVSVQSNPAVLDECLATGQGTACLGLMAADCRAVNDIGETMLGITLCAVAETNDWHRRVKLRLRRVKDLSRAADRDAGDWAANLRSRTETLDAAQDAWLSYRDAQCAFIYARHGTGSGRGVAREICRMTLTAERFVQLGAALTPP